MYPDPLYTGIVNDVPTKAKGPELGVGVVLGPGEYRDNNGNIRNANGDVVRDKYGRHVCKVKKPGLSGKEGAKDVPSWALGQRPRVGESGKEFATRLMDEKYGPGNYEKGGGSEFSKIQK